MLISFTVTNYRSFHGEQTLSMIANSRIKDHESHLLPLPDQGEHVLPTAIFYGANGAGKSNLVRALTLMQSLVLHGTRSGKGVPHDPFVLSQKARSEPTVLEIRILTGGHLLEYGFKMDNEVILEEWLIRIQGKREQIIFERVTDGSSVTVKLSGSRLMARFLGGDKLKAQAQVGALPNQLFVSTLAGSLPPVEQGEIFGLLRKWFIETLRIISPDPFFYGLPNFLRINNNVREFTEEFLVNASTGVKTLSIASRPVLFSKVFGERLQADPANADVLMAKAAKNKDNCPGVEVMPDGTFMGHYLETEVGSGGFKTSLPFSEHSDGTRRLTHLLPALFLSRSEPMVIVIDEIDRSLHPLLARRFIEYFIAENTGHQSQMILTTHDTNLLDLDLFRRDEIWFVEKNEDGASHLYSLAEFKVRTDLKVDSGYLNGRFGAIPFLGGLDKLFPEPAIEKPAPKKRPKAAAAS
ncbi:MAG: abortive phage resistance protein-like protein [Verrucomicrobiales bacterium]|nr:abortive phage resistance protein-like protein [Verrucomicrobiales bacterium]